LSKTKGAHTENLVRFFARDHNPLLELVNIIGKFVNLKLE
jgi:hypothetical protein